jgi:integrase
VRLSRAIDLWLGELARGGRTESTRRSYERYLFKFVGQLEGSRPDVSVSEVTTNDCRAFLDRWSSASASTVCTIQSALNGFFSWVYLEGELDANPMVRIARPRRQRPEDTDVVIVTQKDVQRMLAASSDWQEFLCLSVLAYLGPRRDSASRLRWRDGDLDEGTLRFHEKGGKVSVKPMPDDLTKILRAASQSGQSGVGQTTTSFPTVGRRASGALSGLTRSSGRPSFE